MDPALRTAARILPRGYALNRGLAVQRATMTLLGRIGAGRAVPVVAVDADVSVPDANSGAEIVWERKIEVVQRGEPVEADPEAGRRRHRPTAQPATRARECTVVGSVEVGAAD